MMMTTAASSRCPGTAAGRFRCHSSPHSATPTGPALRCALGERALSKWASAIVLRLTSGCIYLRVCVSLAVHV